MSDPHAMQRLCGLMRKAVQDYEMISPGDKIMVGVSGGKDSVALTIGLAQLRRYLGFDYEVGPSPLTRSLTIRLWITAHWRRCSPGMGSPTRCAAPRSAPSCLNTGRKRTPVPSAPGCAGARCTRRRRSWPSAWQLGHHLDDAVETFYMNLWREGRIGCFSPVTQLDRRGLALIRPMLLATEHEVRCAVKEEDFPIVKSRCPADGVTVREQTKDFVRERCRTNHAFRQKTLHALQESGIDGWRPVHTGRTSNPSPKEGMHHADAEL